MSIDNITSALLVGVFPCSFVFEIVLSLLIEPSWFMSDLTLMRVRSDPMERRAPQVDMSL